MQHQIERVPTQSLVLDPANARKHSTKNLEAIKGSLVRFGQVKPIVVDPNGVVLAGNGTLTAARELGWAHVDIVRTALRGSEATAYALADNRTGELAEWDQAALASLVAALEVEEFPIEEIGFSYADFNFELPPEVPARAPGAPPPTEEEADPWQIIPPGERVAAAADEQPTAAAAALVHRIIMVYEADTYARVIGLADKAMAAFGVTDMSRLFELVLEKVVGDANPAPAV